MQAATKQARVRAASALLALGIQPPVADRSEVIDVQPTRSGHLIVDTVKRLARQTSQGVSKGIALCVGVAVLGLALWAMGIFVGAAALAYVVLTRGFGLRIDLGTPRPA